MTEYATLRAYSIEWTHAVSLYTPSSTVLTRPAAAADSPPQVDVTRSVRDQYGTIEWVVTFTENPSQTPPGAGDIPKINIVQNFGGQPATAGNAVAAGGANPDVEELVKGSTSLSGSFTVDYGDPSGPRTFAFDESDER